MEVKIVGAASDEAMLEEIESVAKVFLYEQRMKTFTAHLTHRRRIKPQIKNEQRLWSDRKMTSENPIHILVKGLC